MLSYSTRHKGKDPNRATFCLSAQISRVQYKIHIQDKEMITNRKRMKKYRQEKENTFLSKKKKNIAKNCHV